MLQGIYYGHAIKKHLQEVIEEESGLGFASKEQQVSVELL